jgi:Ca2+-binding EF-hand superfamily protein
MQLRWVVGSFVGSFVASGLVACGGANVGSTGNPGSDAVALTQGATPQVFQTFDKNGDGAIDATEVPADVWAVLSKADANGDGKVTLDEIVNGLTNGVIKPPKHGHGQHPHSPPFWILDKNHDGAIDQSEAGKYWPELQKADANGDGKVTEDELKTAIKNGTFNPADILFVHLDTDGNGSISQAEAGKWWPLLAPADTDGNGEVSQAEFDAAIAAGKLPAPPAGGPGKGGPGTPGGNHGGPSGTAIADQLFDKLDTDKSGFLEAGEVPEPFWSELLKKADTDGDGKVSKAEFEAAFPHP